MSFPFQKDIIASFCSRLRIIIPLSFSLQTHNRTSIETFSHESFDTKYTQANLMDLLTDWQVQGVVIQLVFLSSETGIWITKKPP